MDTSNTEDGRWAMGKAYYLMHLTGLMDFRLGVDVPADETTVLFGDSFQNGTSLRSDTNQVTSPTYGDSSKTIGKNSVGTWKQVGIDGGPLVAQDAKRLRFKLYLGTGSVVHRIELKLDNSAVSGGTTTKYMSFNDDVVRVNAELGNEVGLTTGWNEIEIDLMRTPAVTRGTTVIAGLAIRNHDDVKDIFLDEINLVTGGSASIPTPPPSQSTVIYEDSVTSSMSLRDYTETTAVAHGGSTSSFEVTGVAAWQTKLIDISNVTLNPSNN